MQFLQGKKTYIGAGVLVVLGIAGAAFGVVTPAEGVGFVAAGLAAFGLGDKATRFNREIAETLTEIRAIVAAKSAGKPIDVAAEAKKFSEIGAEAMSESITGSTAIVVPLTVGSTVIPIAAGVVKDLTYDATHHEGAD